MLRSILLASLLVGLVSVAHAAPCRLPWHPVERYTNGDKVSGKVIYRLWYQATPSEAPVEIATTDGLMVTLPNCKAGNYLVSAMQADPDVQESDLSPPLTKYQLKPPKGR